MKVVFGNIWFRLDKYILQDDVHKDNPLTQLLSLLNLRFYSKKEILKSVTEAIAYFVILFVIRQFRIFAI